MAAVHPTSADAAAEDRRRQRAVAFAWLPVVVIGAGAARARALGRVGLRDRLRRHPQLLLLTGKMRGRVTMAEIEHTGRCLCGAIRYRAMGVPKWIANCHCESCRRATGAPLTTYAGFPAESFAYLTGEPERFHSTPGVTRTFCGRCGTPLTYEGARWPGETHVLIGTMDRPQDFVPTRDAFVEEKLPWLHLTVEANS